MNTLINIIKYTEYENYIELYHVLKEQSELYNWNNIYKKFNQDIFQVANNIDLLKI